MRREGLSTARSLLTTYLDGERQPTTRDNAKYVVERVEGADGHVVSESERALDRAQSGEGQAARRCPNCRLVADFAWYDCCGCGLHYGIRIKSENPNA